MRSLRILASSLSACASPSPRSAHTSTSRPAPISPMVKPSTTTRAWLTLCITLIKSGPLHRRNALPHRWAAAGWSRAGRAPRSSGPAPPSRAAAAARPSVQSAGMCMCRSTKRRCPERRRGDVVEADGRVRRTRARVLLDVGHALRARARCPSGLATELPHQVHALAQDVQRHRDRDRRVQPQPAGDRRPATTPTTTPAEVQTSVIRWRRVAFERDGAMRRAPTAASPRPARH